MRVSVNVTSNLWMYEADPCFRFCGQDEEHDPSEEFEEYMACAVCGDNCEFRIFGWLIYLLENLFKL